jgi:phosphotransferase system HPr (HPr) family protein
VAVTRVVIQHKVGLHARPASLFVRTANRYAAEVRVTNLTGGGAAVDAKSILGVLTLGAQQNHELLIEAVGSDAEAALDGLKSLVAGNFGEA